VYRGTASGAENVFFRTTRTSFIDVNARTSSGTPPGPKLTLKNLSHLYRIASFARSLDLSVGELLFIKALVLDATSGSGIDPFNALNPEGTREFVDATKRI